MQNHYQTLRLEPNCTNAQIKSARKELLNRYHPDKHQSNPIFEEKTKEINEAYNTLIDSEKRRKHDEFHKINNSASKVPQKYSEKPQTISTYKPTEQVSQTEIKSNHKIEKIKNFLKILLFLVMAAGIIWLSIWMWVGRADLWIIILVNLFCTAPLLVLSILGMINRDFLK